MTTLHTSPSSTSTSTSSSSSSSSTTPLGLRDSSSVEHHRWTSLTSTLFLYGDDHHDMGKEPHPQRWWDESQLAVELAEDMDNKTKTKKRLWYTKRTHTLRRFHIAGHKISRSFRRFTAGLV